MDRDWRLLDVPYHRAEEAADLLARAFEKDSIIGYIVPPDTEDRYKVLKALFLESCLDRLALRQPFLMAEWNNKMVATACVVSTYTPPPTEAMKRTWEKTKEVIGPGVVARLEEYEALRKKNMPPRLCHYLLSLGVDPGLRNMGFGRALLDSVIDVARQDPTSAGVLLDTDADANLVFYERAGFTLASSAKLGGVNMAYMYKGVR